jgi:thiamine pyrophosphokinase
MNSQVAHEYPLYYTWCLFIKLDLRGFMRGIAFIGGAGPGAALCRELAADADIIAAADSGLIAAENAGLNPHWIIGDMDSLGDLRRLEKYPPERVLRYPADKDYTDTELVLRLLWDQGCDETWLVGGGGGRTDHLFAIRSLFEREPSPDRWISGAEDIYRVKPGATLSASGEGERKPDFPVSVFPLGSGPWKAESRSLKWPLDALRWDRGFFGLSNIARDGSFSIRAARGSFMVIIPLVMGPAIN